MQVLVYASQYVTLVLLALLYKWHILNSLNPIHYTLFTNKVYTKGNVCTRTYGIQYTCLRQYNCTASVLLLLQVVLDNRRLKCVCHGVSGSCSVKTCAREIPSIFEIGDILRAKYDEAVKVNVVIAQNGDSMIQKVDRRREQEGAPLSTELIYVEMSTNHCSVDPEYTTSRFCMPQSELTAVSSKFYPPCEDFCCSGTYESMTRTVVETCNCYFEFCCSLTCDSCENTHVEYRCSSPSNTNTTSNT